MLLSLAQLSVRDCLVWYLRAAAFSLGGGVVEKMPNQFAVPKRPASSTRTALSQSFPAGWSYGRSGTVVGFPDSASMTTKTFAG